MSTEDRTVTADELWAALWECLQATGADTSAYTDDVWTKAGRAAGLEEFKRHGTPAEVVAAVEAMDEDGLTIEEDAAVLMVVDAALNRPRVTWHPLTEARLRSAREKLR